MSSFRLRARHRPLSFYNGCVLPGAWMEFSFIEMDNWSGPTKVSIRFPRTRPSLRCASVVPVLDRHHDFTAWSLRFACTTKS